MTDLTQFLRDRLNEDERIARAADPDLSKLTGWIEVEYPETKADEEHALRHAPPRILTEVESKREILETCETFLHEYEGGPDPCAHGVLRSLARPYRSHPDFDASWLDD
ncbi:hypothetical protein GCM10023084_03220 [Streptomyces lacrimifluminis]|uniref:DUF6221 family protein n=1 Tax=Streptomyces lacrimifluminis TaxID=1500077 RepID=UPI0031EAFD9F